MGRKVRTLAALLLCLLLYPGSALAAQEQILSYDAGIEVGADSTVKVSEEIQVESQGIEIRRGIYRDFPTTYRDKKGNRIKVDFTLLEVRRDGLPENYKLESMANGVRIRIGREDVLLSPGRHTYAITYQVKRVLGFFPDWDELYWNVTGNGWSFPILAASAEIKLPPGVSPGAAEIAAYTGYAGDSGSDYRAELTETGVKFSASRPLAPKEGLTVVVGWPKGFVRVPGQGQKLLWFLRDNLGILFALLATVLPFFMFLFAWNKVGRDPAKGVVFPRYSPPPGFSPAALRFIRQMGYDDKAFTAAIINLAVLGRLVIHQEKKRKFSLTNTREGTPAPPEEEALHRSLFSAGDTLELKNTNHHILSTAIQDLKKRLEELNGGKYFRTNFSKLLPGIFLGLGLLALGFVFALRNGGPWAVAAAVLSTLVLLILIFVFAHFIKAPTPEGRDLMDEIEGFKMFLEVAEKDYLQWSAPPERTPELFEQFLPHALALGVQQQWAEKFATVLAAASAAGQGYQPVWYRGEGFATFSAASFANTLGSTLNQSIAASATAPGSSSGFSGGSSGGGGGGGGGGGW